VFDHAAGRTYWLAARHRKHVFAPFVPVHTIAERGGSARSAGLGPGAQSEYQLKGSWHARHKVTPRLLRLPHRGHSTSSLPARISRMPASTPRRKPANVDITRPIPGSPETCARQQRNGSSDIIERTTAKAIAVPRTPPAVTVSQGCRCHQLPFTGSVTPFMGALSNLPPSNGRGHLLIFDCRYYPIARSFGSTLSASSGAAGDSRVWRVADRPGGRPGGAGDRVRALGRDGVAGGNRPNATRQPARNPFTSLYPFASGGPVVFTARRQEIVMTYGRVRFVHGWFIVPSRTLRTLERAGLPAMAPEPEAVSQLATERLRSSQLESIPWAWPWVLGMGALATAAGAFLQGRRRSPPAAYRTTVGKESRCTHRRRPCSAPV
jgi:hypothetical protein